MYKNIIFDLDGTLIDTREGIVEGVGYTIEKMHFPKLSHEQMLKFVGPPLKQSFMNYCGCPEEDVPEAIKTYRERYTGGSMYNAYVYDGIIELLEKYKKEGRVLAVATNKPERLAVMLFEHFNMLQYFDLVCGPGLDEKGTKVDSINRCISELGLERSETLMVGDTIGDAEAAKETQTGFVGVSFGCGFKNINDLNGYPCVAFIESPRQLHELDISSL